MQMNAKNVAKQTNPLHLPFPVFLDESDLFTRFLLVY
jgi:hypothetical protein